MVPPRGPIQKWNEPCAIDRRAGKPHKFVCQPRLCRRVRGEARQKPMNQPLLRSIPDSNFWRAGLYDVLHAAETLRASRRGKIHLRKPFLLLLFMAFTRRGRPSPLLRTPARRSQKARRRAGGTSADTSGALVAISRHRRSAEFLQMDDIRRPNPSGGMLQSFADCRNASGKCRGNGCTGAAVRSGRAERVVNTHDYWRRIVCWW